MSKIVTVKLWGTNIGYLGYSEGQSQIATFVYDENFMRSNIQISPLKMKYPPELHEFNNISQNTFHGLPGVFADSLPDKFGNQLIDAFMAQKTILNTQVTALDRLMYVGNKGMGALEYHPLEFIEDLESSKTVLDVSLLSELSDMVIRRKSELFDAFRDEKTKKDALRLLKIGSSAGGARAKALVATDKENLFYDGTIDHGVNFRYWLLKFDTSENSDRDGKDPKGMTKVEYIYAHIAKNCGIKIPEVSFCEDGDDFHFMIERFDRIKIKEKLNKLHYISWAGLEHADRDTTGAYSYEQIALSLKQMKLGQGALTELYKRAIFNIVGRNHDDHSKNFGFLMNKVGEWSFSPAFDMTYSFDPNGKWTKTHQIKLNTKQDDFTMKDLIAFGNTCNLSEKKSHEIIKKTIEAFDIFESMAEDLKVERLLLDTISINLRRNIK
ncbi:MAG: type II toxin-antitoxin system HipA family toxin [Sulfurospirillum sp.]|nr:type II toxin-antitoxin system HipA family toxin [Sulfurospirillum sp.]